jgi:hypothetical protein
VPSPPTLPGARSVGILDVPARFARLDRAEEPADYNFAHFRTKHLVQDARRTVAAEGVVPGQPAPDFELPRADGLGTLRLSDLRGRPVLLHFGSFT